MAYYALTRNTVVGPGTDNITNAPNLSAGATSLNVTQVRFFQQTYTAAQSFSATGIGNGDTIFLPDTDWITLQVYLSGTATYSVEGTCAPANVVSGNYTGPNPFTVAWTAISTGLTAATTSQIASTQGFTAIRINITSYTGGNVVFSVRA